MWRLVRLTLMWLLAAALPLQSVSAATMRACGVGQHGHMTVQAASHSHSTAAHAHAHAHGADASAGRHEHTEVGHVHPGTASQEDGAHKCSACASCCVSAVVSTQGFSFEPVTLTDHFALLAARAFAAFVPEGFERPPRLFLA